MQCGGASPLLQESMGCAGGTWPGPGGCWGTEETSALRREHKSGKLCLGEEGQEHRAEGAWCADAQRWGEDVAPSEAGRFSQEHATAVVRAVGEAARGWPGSGWRRHREGGQTADKCGEGAMRLALWHHHWLRWVEGPGGGWDLPQGDQLRDGHSSG